MARVQYSAAATQRHDVAAVPDRLATWYVNDWITDDDAPPPHVLGRDYRTEGERREQLFLARVLLSRRRFIEARAAHLHQAETTGRPLPLFPPVGRPRWRDPNTRKALL